VSIFSVKIAALGSNMLKRVTGRIFKLVISKEHSETMSMIFPSSNKQQI
jgi:hypothetical protein